MGIEELRSTWKLVPGLLQRVDVSGVRDVERVGCGPAGKMSSFLLIYISKENVC